MQAPAPGTHRCAMPGCTCLVGDTYIMCRPHWGIVPRDFQKELHKAFLFTPSAHKQRQIAEYAVALALESLSPSARHQRQVAASSLTTAH